MELSYISGKGNLKKHLVFLEVTFPTRKIKKSTMKQCLISRDLSGYILYQNVF